MPKCVFLVQVLVVLLISGCAAEPGKKKDADSSKEITASEIWGFSVDTRSGPEFAGNMTINAYNDGTLALEGTIVNRNASFPLTGTSLIKSAGSLSMTAVGLVTYTVDGSTTGFTMTMSGTLSSTTGSGSLSVDYASSSWKDVSGTWTAAYVSGSGIFH